MEQLGSSELLYVLGWLFIPWIIMVIASYFLNKEDK